MRDNISLNADWRYFRGCADGCTAVDYDDSAWTRVNLPHNTGLYTRFDKNAYQGISVYRKRMRLPWLMPGKRCFLTFDGVMQRCQVYLDGELIAKNNNGCIPFVTEVTDRLCPDRDHVITVITDSRASLDCTPGKEHPDYQYFGGIHRNVFLTVVGDLYITDPLVQREPAGGGIFITAPYVTRESAHLSVRTQVKNAGASDERIVLRTQVQYQGVTVASAEAIKLCRAGDTVDFHDHITVNEPSLWSVYAPNLYTIYSCVYCGETLIDELCTPYGIRRIEWNHEGLYINGERFLAQGANLHTDIFVLGSAIPDNEIDEEIRSLKENGFDFIRMAHYPHPRAYYDACDRYGVLVLNCMSGWQYFNDSDVFCESTYDELRTMIRYTRNHPCIVAWETSLNESNYTEAWARTVHTIAHEEYPTDGMSRLYTAGWRTDEYDLLLGASQHGVREHADHSDKGVIISEYGDWDYGGSFSSSRAGREDGDRALLVQAANHIESAILTRSKSWYAADALWCYADYAGGAPKMNYGGIVDMFRLNKYSAYFYRSQRNADVDMSMFGINGGGVVFIADSLSDDSSDTVTVFSNCAQIELFSDGVSLGRQAPDGEFYGNNSGRMLQAQNLPHPPFTFRMAKRDVVSLTAVGYLDGREAARHTVRRAGRPAALRLCAQSERPIAANGSDVKLIWVSIIDENGTVVRENRTVSYSVEGGYVVGYERDDTLAGQTGVWVRANYSERDTALMLRAESDGLIGDVISVAVTGVSAEFPPFDGNEYAGWLRGAKNIDGMVYDVASEKPAFSSSDREGSCAQYANNGEPSTYWYPKTSDGSWWYVDLLEVYALERIEIAWDDYALHAFVLECSQDKVTWTELADRTQGAYDSQSVCAVSAMGRYVRIRLVSAAEVKQGINVFCVYGK